MDAIPVQNTKEKDVYKLIDELEKRITTLESIVYSLCMPRYVMRETPEPPWTITWTNTTKGI